MSARRILTPVFILMFAMSTIAWAGESAIDTIAKDYAQNKDDVQTAYDSGMSFEDINHLAFVSMATAKSFNEVSKYKNIGVTWEKTASLAGITKWHIENGQRQLIANQLYNIFNSPKEDVLSLLTQRYHPKAVALIAAIAQVSAADMELIAAKKHGNTWYEVAKQINLPTNEIDRCIVNVNRAFAERAVFNDYYGRYGQIYGYNDNDFNSGGYDIERIK